MFKAFAMALLAFGILDLIWLRLMSSRLYLPEIGSIMRAAPEWRAAAVFYGIYAFGMANLIILPACASGYPERALQSGAVLGLVAYATYNLTNMATLRGWSRKVTILDIAWGVCATALTCWAVTYAMVMLATPEGA
ncbi:MAG: DUF2177 family protein [Caulobacterales bacterium]